MKLRTGTVMAGLALVAAGAVMGALFMTSSPPAASAAGVADAISFKAGFAPVVKQVMPAVVSIDSTRVVKRSQMQLPNGAEDFFGRFFGERGFQFENPQQLPDQRSQGLGSGVIISDDGYVVTNSHVVEGADEVKVTLQDKRQFDAKVVGNDKQADIAVLKIDATNLPTAPLADSTSVQVGDFVLAMGSPFGLRQTVTMGIVGATGRRNLDIESFEDFIQTDAAINPGNSGGPLVNMDGQVVGINTAILSGNSGGNQGVGFAIPAAMAKNVADQLISHGKVTRGFMGVMIQGVNADIAKQFGLTGGARGALIGDVTAGSPADKAGLKRGDIVLKLNGNDVPDNLDLRLKVASMTPGSTIRLGIFRDGKESEHTLTLGELPGEEQVSRNGSGGSAEDAGPRLGISIAPVTPQIRQQFNLNANTNGVVINEVTPGSPAAEAQLQAGDVIVEVNRTPVRDAEQFRSQVRNAKGPLLLLVSHNGSTHFVTVQPR
jgi:serine protease Do